eukprot:1871777-Amphidinium_carterae.1
MQEEGPRVLQSSKIGPSQSHATGPSFMEEARASGTSPVGSWWGRCRRRIASVRAGGSPSPRGLHWSLDLEHRQ